MKEKTCRVWFTLENEYDQTFTAASEFDPTDPVQFLFTQFDSFLRQCGYYRPHNMILEESLTADEYNELSKRLHAMRSSKRAQLRNDSDADDAFSERLNRKYREIDIE